MLPRPLALALALCALTVPAPANAGDGSWSWPVPQAGIATAFERPETDYAAGHRGVDLPAQVGAPVTSVATGVVTFVGTIAGVGVVTIDHGSERSTYQPVSPRVEIGDRVDAGTEIGRLGLGPFHCATPCVHLGRVAQADDSYLDPLDRLNVHSRVRLVDPDGPPPVPPPGPTGAGIFGHPVGGPMTSAFGLRRHPMTGRRTLHDGVDFAAPCGADVRAAGPGTVAAVRRSPTYGLRVVLHHRGGFDSSYSHLSDSDLDVGDDVSRADVIGRVGSTGISTGCHLHFGVRHEGRAVDPLTVL